MRVWPAFVVAPFIALLDQSAAYALVQWSCATQNEAVLHWVHFIFLALAVIASLPAWAAAAGKAGLPTPDAAGPAAGRARTMSIAAAMIGALSALVILAMWAPTWFLSPCFG